MTEERPIVFECGGKHLVGILHPSFTDAKYGVVIVVGGPQYRVGSHRQFVLIARYLAQEGIPVLRFDYRGMGDAHGSTRMFDNVSDDIRSAINSFTNELPEVQKVVLFGLCDAASANLIYAHTDNRVGGLILVNPWVRTTQGEAQSYLRYYYVQRLFQKSFWRKIVSGDFSFGKSLRELFETHREARKNPITETSGGGPSRQNFIDRMLFGIERFQNPVLLLISGRDLTAREFSDLCKEDDHWNSIVSLPKVTKIDFPEADHTMSDHSVLMTAADNCSQWILRNLGARNSSD